MQTEITKRVDTALEALIQMPQQRKSGIYVPPEVNATEQRVITPVATQQTQTTILLPTPSPQTGAVSQGGNRVVTVGATSWYYVKKPSGICERMKVSQKFVDVQTPRGWVFSRSDICKTPPKGCTCEPCPPERIAIGTCPPRCDKCDEPQTECATCPPDTIPKGTYGSILDPCRCESPPEPPCDLGCLMTARGCDCGCKDVKPCTTCDSTICKECDAWDLQCEDCRKKDGTCTPPLTPCDCLPLDFGCQIKCWWDEYGIYVMVIGGLIGLGILLYLLRPLFGVAKNITEK